MNIKQVRSVFGKKDNSLYGSAKVKELMGILYHENSKLDQYSARQLGESIAYFSDPYLAERYTKPHKRYFGVHHQFDSEALAENADDFFKLISERRSVRKFDSEYQISLFELENLMYYSYGITRKEKINNNGGFMGYRNVPSAGGLYPLEVYVCLFNSHIEPGLYHYDSLKNSLAMVRPGNHLPLMKKLIMAAPAIDMDSACGVILVNGLIERQAIKYGERSYRFMQQECGSLTYLMSIIMENMGLGSCYTGGFIDQELNNFMQIDGNYETVLCPVVFGKKKT